MGLLHRGRAAALLLLAALAPSRALSEEVGCQDSDFAKALAIAEREYRNVVSQAEAAVDSRGRQRRESQLGTLSQAFWGGAPEPMGFGLSFTPPAGVLNDLLAVFQSGGDYAAFTSAAWQARLLSRLEAVFAADTGDGRLFRRCLAARLTTAWAGTHRAVELVAKDSPRGERGLVLDPWVTESPIAYPFDSWRATFAMEALEPRAEIPPWASKEPAGSAHVCVGAVSVLATDDAGRRIGHLADGSFVAELPGSGFFRWREPRGGLGTLLLLPRGDHAVAVTGLRAGRMNYLRVDGPTQATQKGRARFIRAVPIDEGEVVSLSTTAVAATTIETRERRFTLRELQLEAPRLSLGGHWVVIGALALLGVALIGATLLALATKAALARQRAE